MGKGDKDLREKLGRPRPNLWEIKTVF